MPATLDRPSNFLAVDRRRSRCAASSFFSSIMRLDSKSSRNSQNMENSVSADMDETSAKYFNTVPLVACNCSIRDITAARDFSTYPK